MTQEKSTISELEAILNSEDDRNVTINPDGTITVHPTEVEGLRAEIERLRAVLQQIHDDLEDCWAKRQAAAALEPEPTIAPCDDAEFGMKP